MTQRITPGVAAEIEAEWRLRLGREPVPPQRRVNSGKPKGGPPVVQAIHWVEPAPSRPPADPVSRVTPGTYPARGFSMIGGTIR